jgi:hypothetical protein
MTEAPKPIEQIDAPQGNQEVSWKYANPEKADDFRKKFPNLNATDQEVEDAAYSVYWNKENGFNDLDEAWKSPEFQELMADHISRYRDLQDSDDKLESELSQEVSWKYANPEKADDFRKKFPNLNATDQEVEDAAYSVYWNKENGFNDLDEAWKSPFFPKLMKLHILENRNR